MKRAELLGWVVGPGVALAWAACISLPSFSPPETGGNVSIQKATPGTSPMGGSTATNPGASPASGATPMYTSYLHQSAGSLMDATGQHVTLHGIGWYGFDQNAMLDLPPTANRLGTDVVVVMQRLHLMGFNTVAFTFSFAQLYNSDGSYVYATSSVKTMCGGTSTPADIYGSVTIPGFGPSPNTPLLSNIPLSAPGMCNDYLPDVGAPVVQRMAAIVDIFTRNGFYVLLQESMKNDTNLWSAPDTFANRWSALSADLVNYGGQYDNMPQASCTTDQNNAPLALCRNLLLGIMSDIETVSPNMTWEANLPTRLAGAHLFFTGAMAAIGSILPRAMLVVGGALQNGFATTYNTGVDPQTGSAFPTAAGNPAVASASPFFDDVLNAPYENRVMFSFNSFGPLANHALAQDENDMDSTVVSDMDAAYGTLNGAGVPDYQHVMHTFPVMPVALGGNPSDTNDSAFLTAMQTYMAQHNMSHFVWWCWDGVTYTHSNLVDATEYQTLNAPVVNYLKGLGLSPPR